MATVGLHQGVAIAKVLVDVSDSDTYSPFARWYGVTHDFTTVPGWLFFPDGYVDQTDVVLRVDKETYWTGWGWGTTKSPNDANRPKMIISYNSFEKIVDAGALFFSAAVGVYAGGWVFEGTVNNTCAGYYMEDSAYRSSPSSTSLSYKGMNVAASTFGISAARSWSYYSAVRLVRAK